jgi:hypothetical protein
VLRLDLEQTKQAWELTGLAPPGTTAEDIGVVLKRIAERQRRRGDRQITEQRAGGLRPASRAASRGPVAFKRSCTPLPARAA